MPTVTIAESAERPQTQPTQWPQVRMIRQASTPAATSRPSTHGEYSRRPSTRSYVKTSTRGTSRRQRQGSFITQCEERRAKESCSEFPMPKLGSEFALLPGKLQALPRMRESASEMEFDSQAEENRFWQGWLTEPAQTMLIAFVWHAMSLHFQPDEAREAILLTTIGSAYGQLFTSTGLEPEVKDALAWHLPEVRGSHAAHSARSPIDGRTRAGDGAHRVQAAAGGLPALARSHRRRDARRHERARLPPVANPLCDSPMTGRPPPAGSHDRVDVRLCAATLEGAV